jgi:transcriptional regulator with PAS, ATPase and Fis domain
VEDRLFGHVKGAFTGADTEARGAFEEAHQGTLFLDEIGELPAEVQAQLLRVLEEKEIRPLGTMKTRVVDVRIVTATHRDLGRMVAEGKFRQDLFYRVNVLLVRVPPLCERLEDMKSIAAHVVSELEKSKYTLKLNKKDWDAIQRYDWPGNVRQFLNVLKRAAYLKYPVAEIIDEESRHSRLDASIEASSLHTIFFPESIEDVLPVKEMYRTYVQHVLGLFEGNIMRTARALKIASNTLRKYLL